MNFVSFGVITLMLLLSSCGKRKAPSNDPRFDIYKIQFQKEAAKRGVEITDGEIQIPVSFGETGTGFDGACIIPSMGTNAFDTFINDVFNDENYDRKFVIIHPEILQKDLFYIEAVVFHELAHCLLNREHTHERSIMNPSQENNGDYPFMRSVYLDELFGLNPNFDDSEVVSGCALPDENTEWIEETLYSAFGREFQFTMYPQTRNTHEVFCVNPKL